MTLALTGVAQLAGASSVNQKTVGLIPSQATCLGCGFGPWLGAHARGNRSMCLSHINVSPPLYPPFLSLKINNKTFFEKKH